MDPVLLPKKLLHSIFCHFYFTILFCFFSTWPVRSFLKLIKLDFFMTEHFFNWQNLYKLE